MSTRERVLLISVLFGVFSAATVLAQQEGETASKPASGEQASEPAPTRVRVSSGVQSGLLIKKVAPQYPESARSDGIQGTVILRATISKGGEIKDLELISGEPTLAKAAIKAVKKWKYKPYILQGQPVEVETQIQVNFTLAGG
ncbi:MAG TPA: energy transducer TonB [Candidatus Dormibacteraeota bacterium]|nr:energy transducer TonB [Candidatus Dormibacteraeota bacterium]